MPSANSLRDGSCKKRKPSLERQARVAQAGFRAGAARAIRPLSHNFVPCGANASTKPKIGVCHSDDIANERHANAIRFGFQSFIYMGKVMSGTNPTILVSRPSSDSINLLASDDAGPATSTAKAERPGRPEGTPPGALLAVMTRAPRLGSTESPVARRASLNPPSIVTPPGLAQARRSLVSVEGNIVAPSYADAGDSATGVAPVTQDTRTPLG